MFLSEPTKKYKQSFIEAMRETEEESSDTDIHKRITEAEQDFDKYLNGLKEQEKGKNLKPEHVPQTTYWLIDNDEYIGAVRIRHSLNEALMKEGGHIGYDIRPSKRKLGYGSKILALVLPKAKILGITKALLTCNSTNTGSIKIIEKNGGILWDKIPGGVDKPDKLRYWIEIK